MNHKFIKILTIVILFFFSWSFAGICSLAHAVDKGLNQPPSINNQTGREQKPEVKFQKAIEEITEILENPATDREIKTKKAKAKRAEIEELDREVKRQFAETEKKLRDAELPHEILQRHHKFVKHYEDNLNELKGNIDAIEKTKGLAVEVEIEKAKKHLERVKPPKRHTPLDPNKLPHRTPKVERKEPRLKKEDFERDFPKPKKAQGQKKPILVASTGSLKGLLSEDSEYRAQYSNSPNSELITPNFQTAQATNIPTPEDLAQNIEVQFTPEIIAKAQELGNNPVKIYNWVRNNIEFVPTYGSIQGANMTLLTKQGNAFDTASLLIALLRASNIPARYVYGTIELPIDKVMNWVGGFTDPNAALDFIASGGIPVTGIIAGGKVTKARLEHVWVEAWVPYDHYRGAKVTGVGNKVWVPMDSSLKEYEAIEGIDLFQSTGFDAQNFLNEVKNHSVYNESESYVTSVDQAFINQKIQDIRSTIDAYIQANMPNATLPDVFGYRKIISKEYGILLASMPFKVISTLSKFSNIPSNLRHKIAFRGYDPSGYLGGELSFQTTLPEVVGKRITLSYTAATDADRDVINRYGDLSLVPAYLVMLKPVLRISGTVIAEGPALGLGSNMQFTMSFTNAQGISEDVENVLTVGGYHAITLNTGAIANSSVQNIATNLQALINIINSGQGGIFPDDLFGEMLHAVGAVYFYEADALNKLVAKLMKVRTLKHSSEAIISIALRVSYMFYLPMKIEPTGLNIDVDRNLESRLPLNGDVTKAIAYSVQSGINSSMMEHLIWDNLFQVDGISAVKILQLANQQGIPIYQLKQDNVSQIIPNLQVNAALKTEIQNLISAGHVVTIPKQNISYNGWVGIGFIALNPATGAGGYIIEGGNAGGDTTGSWALGRASAALLAFVKLLEYTDSIPVGTVLSFLAKFVSFFGVVVNTVDNLFKIQNANISPEAKEMLSIMVIGIGILLALLPLTVVGGPYGIAVGFILASSISMIFKYLVPLVILTAERIENKSR